MAQIAADFSLAEHARIELWAARHPFGLNARVVLDHCLAEEVTLVYRSPANIALWTIVPMPDGKVVLNQGDQAEWGMLLPTVEDALAAIETVEAKSEAGPV